jgi:hypothetical protein
MNHYYSEDIIFLKHIFQCQEVDIYFFHEKYLLSPAQLSRTIRKFKEIDVITEQNGIATLTEKGRAWIIDNKRSLFLQKKSRFWKNIPEHMKDTVISIDTLYLPQKILLNKFRNRIK